MKTEEQTREEREDQNLVRRIGGLDGFFGSVGFFGLYGLVHIATSNPVNYSDIRYPIAGAAIGMAVAYFSGKYSRRRQEK